MSELSSSSMPRPVLSLDEVFGEAAHPNLAGALTDGIDGSLNRFRQIVRGQIRKDLGKFLSSGEIVGRHGKEYVSIPLPRIEVPHFKHGDNDGEGVGQGDGQGQGQGQPGNGKKGQGGSDPGQHKMQEILLEDFLDILGEELKLPRLQRKGSASIEDQAERYNKIRMVGPNSLVHKRRTFLQSLKNAIASGDYDPQHPNVPFDPNARRYRASTVVPKLKDDALCIFVMDISGSITQEMKAIFQQTAGWTDRWLDREYKGCKRAYFVHDVNAKGVTKDLFYKLSVDGGTKISSALEAVAGLLDGKGILPEWKIPTPFQAAAYNTYVWHFSDGDNSSRSDDQVSVKILKERILPRVNQYSYLQADLGGRSGQFLDTLRDEVRNLPEVVLHSIRSKSGIIDAVRACLSPGR